MTSAVDETFALSPHLQETSRSLTKTQFTDVIRAARAQLNLQCPLSNHLLQFRVVRQGTKNYISTYVRREFAHVIHTYSCPEAQTHFLFMPSEKLEPVVVVVAVHDRIGRLPYLDEYRVPLLQQALLDFGRVFELGVDSLLYTPRSARSGFVTRGKQRVHSSHFHVKIKIGVDEVQELLPVSRFITKSIFDMDNIKYHHTREPVSWKTLEETLLRECSVNWSEDDQNHVQNDHELNDPVQSRTGEDGREKPMQAGSDDGPADGPDDGPEDGPGDRDGAEKQSTQAPVDEFGLPTDCRQAPEDSRS